MSNTLRLCTFKGLQNLPVYIAQQQGFFAQHGLEVVLSYTTGSKPQLTGLARGEYDLVQTAPDNVIHINTNPAAFDATAAPRILMVLGGSNGPLGLYAQLAYTTCSDLRGSVLGVDNPTSGYALVLRDMLLHNGLRLNHDYTFTIAGGTSTRLDALRSGAIAATVLYMPFDHRAEAEGFPRLARSTDYYRAYASLATACRQDWLTEHSDEVTQYIRAFLQAVAWIYEPTHAESVQQALINEPTVGLDAEEAVQAFEAFINPLDGFGKDAQLDDAGLEQVIQIRAKYGQFLHPVGSLEEHRDMRYYVQAKEGIHYGS